MDRREFMIRTATAGSAALAGLAFSPLAMAAQGQAPLSMQPPPEGWPAASLRVGAPMRDGVRLATDVWLPEGNGPFPALLVRTPYNYLVVGGYMPVFQQFVNAGYAVIMQFVRGQWGSEGVWRFGGHNERPDGYDAVEWVAAQPWCDGNVGMFGTSYLAMTQLYAAEQQPPHLKAISPIAPVVDFLQATPFQGGAHSTNHMINWTRAVQQDHPSFAEKADDPEVARDIQHRLRQRPLYSAADEWLNGPYLDMYKSFLDHPFSDHEFWDQINYTKDAYSKMDVPMFWVSGHFDVSTWHCIDAWKRIEAFAPPNPHHMLLAPYTHGVHEEVGLSETSHGPYTFADNVITDNVAMRIPFFDRHVKGLDVEADLPERVRVYIMGSNVWRDFSSMPVPEAVIRSVFLSSQGMARTAAGDGTLSFEATSLSGSDEVRIDPENPVIATDPFDMASVIHREDVLVYTSPPLEEPLTIVGQPEAIIHVACDTPDADIVVDFHEVREDGRSIRLSTRILRLRYRHGFDEEILMNSSEIAEVRLLMDWLGQTIPPGSRLRVSIRGTDFPAAQPNPNTGDPIKSATRVQRSNLHIIHTEGNPSRLELPTVSL
jgi:putative CocE/NonD family hydrolase